jgi:predicted acetyltransferase
MSARLVPPSAAYQQSCVEAFREGFRRGDQPAKAEDEIEEIEADFQDYIDRLTVKTGDILLPDGERIPRAPGDIYWLVDGSDFIGEAGVRYALNPWLTQIGGHVGYGIRPRFQNQGYGKLILRLALARCWDQGVRRALVTCYDHNIPSARVIEANGGVLENLIDDPRGGGKSRRYWIDLETRPSEAERG